MTDQRIITNADQWTSFLNEKKYSACVILTDENTSHHCLKLFLTHFTTPNFIEIQIQSGESNKNLEQVEFIWTRMMDNEIDRGALFLCLGGGMVCDIGSFAASTYKRGIDICLIPTTNLAMTDAAIGGKNGINLNGFKNQIGCFQLPKAVLLFTDFLKTLPKRQLRAGHAETIKHALISDATFWHELKEITAFDHALLIQKSLATKLHFVAQDFKDNGVRQALNFGHTVGHAIESISQSTDHPLLHGEAIAIGMVIEAKLSVEYCGLPIETFDEINAQIQKLIPIKIDGQICPEACLEQMKQDKKNKNGKIHFSLLSAVGSPMLEIAIESHHILNAMTATFKVWKA